jgi:hypothetical protein
LFWQPVVSGYPVSAPAVCLEVLRAAHDAEQQWCVLNVAPMNGDRDESLKATGIWSLFGRNIRQNAMDRTRTFIDARHAASGAPVQ